MFHFLRFSLNLKSQIFIKFFYTVFLMIWKRDRDRRVTVALPSRYRRVTVALPSRDRRVTKFLKRPSSSEIVRERPRTSTIVHNRP
jgi:hypothetical protein